MELMTKIGMVMVAAGLLIALFGIVLILLAMMLEEIW